MNVCQVKRPFFICCPDVRKRGCWMFKGKDQHALYVYQVTRHSFYYFFFSVTIRLIRQSSSYWRRICNTRSSDVPVSHIFCMIFAPCPSTTISSLRLVRAAKALTYTQPLWFSQLSRPLPCSFFLSLRIDRRKALRGDRGSTRSTFTLCHHLAFISLLFILSCSRLTFAIAALYPFKREPLGERLIVNQVDIPVIGTFPIAFGPPIA